jgi:hypothetical protein
MSKEGPQLRYSNINSSLMFGMAGGDPLESVLPWTAGACFPLG